MRRQTEATEDTAPEIIPAAPWRVASFQALTGYCLRVCFVDRTEGTVDLSRLIMGKAQVSSRDATQSCLPGPGLTAEP